MNIGERLKEERERIGLSQTALAQIGGVGKTTQIKYEKGSSSPDSAYLSAVSEEGVDIFYVLKGQRLGTPDAQALGLLVVEPGPDLVPVKMYDIEAAAGSGRSFEGEPVQTILQFPKSELAEQGLDAAQIVGVKVRGDSMLGTLEDGDWVLVNRGNRDPKQEGVFLLLVSGERRIKRVQRLAGGALYLISDNELYQPEMIKPQDMGNVEILGRCEIRIGRVV